MTWSRRLTFEPQFLHLRSRKNSSTHRAGLLHRLGETAQIKGLAVPRTECSGRVSGCLPGRGGFQDTFGKLLCLQLGLKSPGFLFLAGAGQSHLCSSPFRHCLSLGHPKL